MMLAAAADSSTQPWWLVIAGIVGTTLVAYLAARGPVWVEKIKVKRSHTRPESRQTGSAEAVLREWLKATIRERDRALKEVDRLEKRIDELEKELYRLGWDGRTA
jgi:hypothetical protein